MKITLIIIFCFLFFTGCSRVSDVGDEPSKEQSVFNEQDKTSIEEPILLDFIFNDSFSGFEVQSFEGGILKEKPLNSDYQVVFYLTERCSTCIEILRVIHRFEKLFCSEKLDYVIYWEDKIPESILEKYSIANERNFSLNGKVKLSAITPTFFILNKENLVQFTTTDFDLIVKK